MAEKTNDNFLLYFDQSLLDYANSENKGDVSVRVTDSERQLLEEVRRLNYDSSHKKPL